MPTLTIPPQNIPPGALRFSATRAVPATSHGITIQMTDSTNSWTTVVGNLMIWGVQVSSDSGANWHWLVWEPGRSDPDTPNDLIVMPFGTVSKGGTLPALTIAGTFVQANAGDLARLAIQVDTAITLGAIITTN